MPSSLRRRLLLAMVLILAVVGYFMIHRVVGLGDAPLGGNLFRQQLARTLLFHPLRLDAPCVIPGAAHPGWAKAPLFPGLLALAIHAGLAPDRASLWIGELGAALLVPLAWWFARRRVGPWRALVPALAVMASPLNLWFPREYGWTALATLSSVALIMAQRRAPSHRHAAALGATLGLLASLR